MGASRSPPPPPPRVMGMSLEQPFECASPLDRLGIDQACLTVGNNGTEAVTLWAQADECRGCDSWPYVRVPTLQFGVQSVNTTYPTRLSLRRDDGTTVCSLDQHFGEFGWYELSPPDDNSSDICSLRVATEPGNIYAPLVFAALALIGLTILIKSINKMNEHYVFHRMIRLVGASSLLRRDLGDPEESTTMLPEDQASNPAAAEKLRTRVQSLDVFRGICIILMIFVNYRGGQYWFFRHARWNGLTVADLVFPWFMWIMGASMVFSLRSQIRRSVPKSQICVRMVRRAALLFLLGLVINSESSQSAWAAGGLRVPGVLQRFAVCSLVLAAMQLPALTAADQLPTESRLAWLRDVTSCWGQWLAAALLAAAHVCVTFLLPVPGCPTGYLGPGGMADGGRFANCTGGAAGYIDRELLGTHMYRHPTAHQIYNTHMAYDPEGLLGTLTSCVAVFLGSVAGRIIVTYRGTRERLVRFAVWTVILGAAAGGLCGFSRDDGLIPVNKNLWSLSFVLALSSLAFALFALLYLLVDVWRIWRGRPFYYAGLNAIVLYLGHELGAGLFPVSLCAVAPPAGTHLAALFAALWGTLVWLFVAWRLYKQRVFIAL